MTRDESVRIREARRDDVPAIAALHFETFREAHGGGPSHAVRESQWRTAFDGGGDWFCYVAEEPGGALLGFAKGTLHDGGVPGYAGELNKIYVLRRHHRRGIGRRLVARVAQRFQDRGIESMLLFGDARNPSNGFYERLGAERIVSPEGEFHGGYGWRDLRRLLAACEGVG